VQTLLLTDKESGKLQQDLQLLGPCTVQPIDRLTGVKVIDPVIVCDVTLDNNVSIALLREALSVHRRSLEPSLFLVRKLNHHMTTQAYALGANAILPSNVSREVLLSRISALRAVKDVPSDRLHDHAAEAGAALIEMFRAAQTAQAIAPELVARGSDAVLEAVKTEGIQSWLGVVRDYDEITYQHCLLVTGLAAAFSLSLGFRLDDQRLLTQGALVHDVGKARIPLEILDKPGKLTASEMEVMRQHPSIGYELLKGQGGFDEQILSVVRHHHEYLDGSGYPDGLRGAQISDLIRLTTICDIYAALIERRSYKAPMPRDKALSILRDMGKRLDGDLVDAFCPIMAI